MEHLANIPITILVKAPNQQIGDQTVECFMDWTVRRLKSHLTAVYPNRPTEKSQRIIYSGKLLQDNSLLKDVLRTIDEETLHTVHLVCTPTAEELADNGRDNKTKVTSQSSGSTTPSRTESAGNSASNSRRTSVSSTDGLRQRHITRTDSNSSLGYSNPYMHQYSLPGRAYQNMNPQQLQWMQHMYMQQMTAYYMQYHSGSSQGIAPPWTPPAAFQFPQPMGQPPMAPANQPVLVPADHNAMPQAAPADPAINAPRVQNQQMNAGVGPAINDDDEEEGANRDWLDWIYTLCRFGVLLSIVYFYSSMNRFLLVAGIMFVVYLYERNFFRLRRHQVARVPEGRENAQEDEPEVAEDHEEDTPDDGSGRGASDEQGLQAAFSTENPESDDQANTGSTEAMQTIEPEGPPRPGIMGLIWIFISTFFTSLFPQGPQHLNA